MIVRRIRCISNIEMSGAKEVMVIDDDGNRNPAQVGERRKEEQEEKNPKIKSQNKKKRGAGGAEATLAAQLRREHRLQVMVFDHQTYDNIFSWAGNKKMVYLLNQTTIQLDKIIKREIVIIFFSVGIVA